MSEPVAWMYKGESWFDGDKWHETMSVTTSKELAIFKDKAAIPLYASSYAMSAADAAKIAKTLYVGDGSRLNEWQLGYNDAIAEYESCIRALSSPPSVDNEWINQRMQDAYNLDIANQVCAGIEATLAALGVTVRG